MEKQAVLKFSTKYLNLYKSKQTLGNEVFDGFADVCFELGFEMDCGNSFHEAYPEENPFESVRSLNRIIEEVVDIKLLGSAIFSHWRYITHWEMYGNLLSDENREWFIVALKRLQELSDFNVDSSKRIL